MLLIENKIKRSTKIFKKSKICSSRHRETNKHLHSEFLKKNLINLLINSMVLAIIVFDVPINFE